MKKSKLKRGPDIYRQKRRQMKLGPAVSQVALGDGIKLKIHWKSRLNDLSELESAVIDANSSRILGKFLQIYHCESSGIEST
jgi:hypothetical protein